MEKVSVSEFAELVGVSTRTVSDLAKRGVIKKTGTGFAWPETLQKYVSHLREQAAARGGEAAADVAKHRSELLRIQTERARFAFETEQELWVTVDDVEANWGSCLRTLRAACLAIPTRVAARCSGLSRQVVYEMIRKSGPR
jgi:phage terminase Nu1 subunit (DNA packaging protein)